MGNSNSMVRPRNEASIDWEESRSGRWLIWEADSDNVEPDQHISD
jgi:hypothetical protein